MGAVHPLVAHHVRAERVPEAPVRALADEVFVDLAEDGTETIGVL
jgi:hypothetical protein